MFGIKHGDVLRRSDLSIEIILIFRIEAAGIVIRRFRDFLMRLKLRQKLFFLFFESAVS